MKLSLPFQFDSEGSYRYKPLRCYLGLHDRSHVYPGLKELPPYRLCKRGCGWLVKVPPEVAG